MREEGLLASSLGKNYGIVIEQKIENREIIKHFYEVHEYIFAPWSLS